MTNKKKKKKEGKKKKGSPSPFIFEPFFLDYPNI